ncbi:MAG: response regulator transcription factor, partial [Bacteroidetes bacterium]|nr:response regulator transcription factor [Bacteroidota bacterium]
MVIAADNGGKKNIKILIADDHSVVRQGLKNIIQEEFPEAAVDEAITGNEVLEKTRATEFDVIVLDISMPGQNGLEILKQLRAESIKTPVLILSMHSEDQYAIRMLKAGASGYLTKDTASEELIEAIKRVLMGRKYITETLAEQLATDIDKPSDKPLHQIITDREFQVLCLIASGKTVSDIATELCLSVPT